MPWIKLPRSGKLVWDPDPWDDETLPISRRIDAAFRAGKRTRALELHEQDMAQRRLAGDPWMTLLDRNGCEIREPIQTTRQAEIKPVDPFQDYLRSAQGGKK
jgi:hypothetical protein